VIHLGIDEDMTLPKLTSLFALASFLAWPCLSLAAEGTSAQTPDLWSLAKSEQSHHRFSTLFTAQDVRNSLATEAGRKQAMNWCRLTGVTHVYIEAYRDGYQAERATLEQAAKEFRAGGFLVSGCITTTKIGKPSSGWKESISCYTDLPTQARLQEIFEFAAGLFDEIMIDDFWFTDCACPQCDQARLAKKVTVGERVYPVAGDTWEDYRCELMVRLSQDRVLGASKKVNPRVRIIIKYPQWYDNFHVRGYEVLRETKDFDKIWVGTETRDYGNSRWGGTAQYEGYFLMRWLGGVGGSKCGGGWYDWLGTTEHTYLEQARQTILAGAKESFLFCYGGLQHDTGPKDVEALRANVPELLQVARQVASRQVVGVAAYKPANSHPENEQRVFDFIGMLGLPLVPCHEFPDRAPAAFFSIHAMKDPDLISKLERYIRSGKPTLITDGLAAKLKDRMKLDLPNVRIIDIRGEPKRLLALGPDELNRLRQPFLKPFKTTFEAPNKSALYLFKDKSWVIENFDDRPAEVVLLGEHLTVPARGWLYRWR